MVGSSGSTRNGLCRAGLPPPSATGRGEGSGSKQRDSKRSREPDVDDSDEDRCAARIRRKRTSPTPDDAKMSFACPFFKRNSMRHMDCLSFKLRRIQDVKQHLQRKHCQHLAYCPICQQEFSNRNQRDDHIRQKTCTESPYRPDTSTGLIPPEKQEKLRARMRGPDKVVWYQIWETLFDDANPPATPYQSTMVEETVGVFQGLWEQHKSEIISDLADDDPSMDLLRTRLPGVVSLVFSKLLTAAARGVDNSDPTSSASEFSSLSRASTAPTEEALGLAPCPNPALLPGAFGSGGGQTPVRFYSGYSFALEPQSESVAPENELWGWDGMLRDMGDIEFNQSAYY